MTLCRRDKDVATRVLKDLEREDKCEKELTVLNKALKESISTEERTLIQHKMDTTEDVRNMLRESLNKW